MAYLGTTPNYGFLEGQTVTFNGSTTQVTLNRAISTPDAIDVFIDNVHQEPDVAYTLDAGGGSITFTGTPVNGSVCYIRFHGQKFDTAQASQVIDSDGDTHVKVEASSDSDTVVVTAGGTAVITANSSGVTIPNLTVTGTTTSVNSTNLNIGDNQITLNSDVTGTPSENAGLIINRGSASDVSFLWNETNDYWFVNEPLVSATRINSIVSGNTPSLDGDNIGLFQNSASSQNAIVSIISNSSNYSQLNFGDENNEDAGYLRYNNSSDLFTLNSPITISGNTIVNGNIDTGSNSITTTGVGSFGSLDISGDIDVDGTTNLDVVDIDGTLNVAGETTLQTHLNMGDGDIIKLGDGADLQIKHDASNSFIRDEGTGNLYLDSVVGNFYVRVNNTENAIEAVQNGAVTLYHNNVAKIATASGGVTVTGDIGATTGTISTGIQLGNGTTDGYILVEGGTNAHNDLVFQSKPSNGGAIERMRISSAGSLGINTATPVANLEIKKTVSTTGSMTDTALHLTTDATTGRKLNIGFGLGGGVANTNVAVIGFDVTSGTGATQGDLFFSTRSGTSDAVPTERMRITSAGNVGIGTSSPDEVLHIHSDSIARLKITGSSGQGEDNGIKIFQNGVNTTIANGDNGYMRFYTNNTERMRINSAGEVLIGTTTQGRETNLAVVGADQLPAGAWSQFGIYSNDSYAVNKGGSMMFGGQDGSLARQFFSAIKGAKENATSGNYAGYLAFFTRPAGSTPLERMRISSAGYVTQSKLPMFNISGGSFTINAVNQQTITSSNGFTSSTEYDPDGLFNHSNGRFTAPVAGRYFFIFSIGITFNSGYHYSYLFKNGSNVVNRNAPQNSHIETVSIQQVINLSAGDYITAERNNNNVNGVVNDAMFCGFLLG